MSFARLQEAILAEAEKQADKVRLDFEKKLKYEEERIGQQASVVEEDIIAKAEKKGHDQARRIHQTAQLSAKARILTVKQEELESTLAQATSSVLAWGKAETDELLAALLALVTDKGGVIVAGHLHKEQVIKLALNKGIRVQEKTIPEDGGFIWRGQDSELNLTVSHLVKRLFISHRAEVAKVLF